MKNGIYRLRKAKNLTLKEVGEKLNLAEVTILQYEKGTREPSLAISKAYAKLLGVSLKKFIDAYEERE